ncbi:MAG: zinc ribbon domain-containing protein [Coriobacteriales bacterium]|nr:zinc ribbon domain-containing protein [Coriobacteriales bacterium]
MHCPNCGTELPNNASFCTECGKPIAQAAPEPPAPEPSPAPKPEPQPAPAPAPQPAPEPKAKPKKEPKAKSWQQNKITAIVLAVAGIALVVVGIIRVVSGVTGIVGGKNVTRDERYFESHGYMTMNALMDLSGEEITEQLKAAGYEYVESDDEKVGVGWRLPDGSGALTAHRGPITDGNAPGTDLTQIPKGGGDYPTVYSFAFENYTSSKDAIDGMCGTTPAKDVITEGNVSATVLESSSGEKFLCVSTIDDANKNIVLANEAMVETGAFSEPGDTIDSLYAQFEAEVGGAGLSGDMGKGDVMGDLITPQVDATTAKDVSKDTSADKDKDADKTQKKDTSTTAVEAPATLTQECLDEFGNPTMYAISELSGKDLVQTLQSQGFSYASEQKLYANNKDSVFLVMTGEDGQTLSDKDIEALEKGGGNTPLVYVLSSTQYKDALAMLQGTDKCVIEDVMLMGDKAVAVVYGPSMQEYLVAVVPDDTVDGRFSFGMYSSVAVAAGLFDQTSDLGEGDKKYGDTISQVWETLTGGSVGDYVRDHPVNK